MRLIMEGGLKYRSITLVYFSELMDFPCLLPVEFLYLLIYYLTHLFYHRIDLDIFGIVSSMLR